MKSIKDKVVRNIKLLDIIKALMLSFIITGMIDSVYRIDDIYVSIIINSIAFAVSYYVFIFEGKRKNRQRISIENLIKENNQKFNDSIVRIYYNIGEVFSEKIFDLEKLIVNTGGTVVESLKEIKHMTCEHAEQKIKNNVLLREEMAAALKVNNEILQLINEEIIITNKEVGAANTAIVETNNELAEANKTISEMNKEIAAANKVANAMNDKITAVNDGITAVNEEICQKVQKIIEAVEEFRRVSITYSEKYQESAQLLGGDIKFLIEKIIDIGGQLKEMSETIGDENENLEELYSRSGEIYSLLGEVNSCIIRFNQSIGQKTENIIKGSSEINDKYIQLQRTFSDKVLNLVEQNNHIGNVLSTTVKTLNNVVNKI